MIKNVFLFISHLKTSFIIIIIPNSVAISLRLCYLVLLALIKASYYYS